MRRARLPHTRVDILRRTGLAYWTARFGVSTEDLRMAVLAVGPRSDRVAAYLGKAS